MQISIVQYETNIFFTSSISDKLFYIWTKDGELAS